MSLGSKIRELRVAKGLTQSDLGTGLVTPSMVSQIESDKANPSYKVLERIAEKLDTPLEYFLVDVQTQLETRSIHKIGRALLSAGRYEKAAEALQTVLNRDSSSVDLIEVNLDLGDCYVHLGKYGEACELFEKSLQIADEKGNQYAALNALYKLGVAEETQHNYHSAVFYWRSAHQRFEQLSLQEPFIQSQILIKLGTIHQELGEFNKALGYLHEAYTLACNSKDHQQIGMIYLELGIGYEKCSDYPRAIEYAQYAAAIFESIHQTKLAIDTKVRYGILLGEMGKLAEAYQTLEACINEYEEHDHSVDAAGVRGNIATHLVKEKRFVEAKNVCEEALSAVTDEHFEKATLLQILGTVEDALRNTEVAIKCLEKAKKLFSQHGALHDKASTLSTLGYLYQKQGEATKANECLQEMKQTYDQLMHERGIIK